MSLRVTWDVKTHTLSFVTRWKDHFTGTSVPETLSVTLLGTDHLPVPSRSGGLRQPDGTYRFTGLPDATYTVVVEDPSGNWSFFDPAPVITVPLANPAVPDISEAWPSAGAVLAPGLTAVRARLVDDTTGVTLPGLQLEIAAAGAGSWPRHTWTDDDGECVFLVTGVIPLNADGVLELEARVESGTRAVTRITVGFDGSPTLGPLFEVSPSRSSRVLFEVAP